MQMTDSAMTCSGGDTAVGCVAMRPLDLQRCEMKRLYVSQPYRTRRLGQALAERICAEARDAGYRSLYLDTLPEMTRAIALYSRLGFVPVEAYVFNPIEGARYLGLAL